MAEFFIFLHAFAWDENDELKDIPVVFLTGVSDRDKIKEAIALRPQGYLLKPIDHNKLMETINNFVR